MKALLLLLLASFANAADIQPAKRTVIQISGGGSDPTKLPLAGGTMTGDIVESLGAGIRFSTGAGVTPNFGEIEYSATGGGKLDVSVPEGDFGVGLVNFISTATEGFVLAFSTSSAFEPDNLTIVKFSTSGVTLDAGGNLNSQLTVGATIQLEASGGAILTVSDRVNATIGSTELDIAGNSSSLTSSYVTAQNLAGESVKIHSDSITITASALTMEPSVGGPRVFMDGTGLDLEYDNNNQIEIGSANIFIETTGSLQIDAGAATGKALCLNVSNILSTCSTAVSVTGTCTCP